MDALDPITLLKRRARMPYPITAPVLSGVTAEQDQSFVESYEAALDAAAKNEMANQLGAGSLGPNTRQLMQALFAPYRPPSHIVDCGSAVF